MSLTKRITKVVNIKIKGTYVFEVVEVPEGFRTSLNFFQSKAKDEGAELTIIEELILSEYHLAITHLYKLIEKEKNRNYEGYNLTKSPKDIIRVKDIYSLGLI